MNIQNLFFQNKIDDLANGIVNVTSGAIIYAKPEGEKQRAVKLFYKIMPKNDRVMMSVHELKSVERGLKNFFDNYSRSDSNSTFSFERRKYTVVPSDYRQLIEKSIAADNFKTRSAKEFRLMRAGSAEMVLENIKGKFIHNYFLTISTRISEDSEKALSDAKEKFWTIIRNSFPYTLEPMEGYEIVRELAIAFGHSREHVSGITKEVAKKMFDID